MAFNYSFRVAVSLAVALLAGVMWTVDVFWGSRFCTAGAASHRPCTGSRSYTAIMCGRCFSCSTPSKINDNAIHFSETDGTEDNRLVNRSLNRVARILHNVKSETAQREKYYELILDCVNTGIIVLNDNGAVYQKNNEALRLLGLEVFTHVRQLSRVDAHLTDTLTACRPGDKFQAAFGNERGTVTYLSASATSPYAKSTCASSP